MNTHPPGYPLPELDRYLRSTSTTLVTTPALRSSRNSPVFTPRSSLNTHFAAESLSPAIHAVATINQDGNRGTSVHGTTSTSDIQEEAPFNSVLAAPVSIAFRHSNDRMDDKNILPISGPVVYPPFPNAASSTPTAMLNARESNATPASLLMPTPIRFDVEMRQPNLSSHIPHSALPLTGAISTGTGNAIVAFQAEEIQGPAPSLHGVETFNSQGHSLHQSSPTEGTFQSSTSVVRSTGIEGNGKVTAGWRNINANSNSANSASTIQVGSVQRLLSLEECDDEQMVVCDESMVTVGGVERVSREEENNDGLVTISNEAAATVREEVHLGQSGSVQANEVRQTNTLMVKKEDNVEERMARARREARVEVMELERVRAGEILQQKLKEQEDLHRKEAEIEIARRELLNQQRLQLIRTKAEEHCAARTNDAKKALETAQFAQANFEERELALSRQVEMMAAASREEQQRLCQKDNELCEVQLQLQRALQPQPAAVIEGLGEKNNTLPREVVVRSEDSDLYSHTATWSADGELAAAVEQLSLVHRTSVIVAPDHQSSLGVSEVDDVTNDPRVYGGFGRKEAERIAEPGASGQSAFERHFGREERNNTNRSDKDLGGKSTRKEASTCNDYKNEVVQMVSRKINETGEDSKRKEASLTPFQVSIATTESGSDVKLKKPSIPPVEPRFGPELGLQDETLRRMKTQGERMPIEEIGHLEPAWKQRLLQCSRDVNEQQNVTRESNNNKDLVELLAQALKQSNEALEITTRVANQSQTSSIGPAIVQALRTNMNDVSLMQHVGGNNCNNAEMVRNAKLEFANFVEDFTPSATLGVSDVGNLGCFLDAGANTFNALGHHVTNFQEFKAPKKTAEGRESEHYQELRLRCVEPVLPSTFPEEITPKGRINAYLDKFLNAENEHMRNLFGNGAGDSDIAKVRLLPPKCTVTVTDKHRHLKYLRELERRFDHWDAHGYRSSALTAVFNEGQQNGDGGHSREAWGACEATKELSVPSGALKPLCMIHCFEATLLHLLEISPKECGRELSMQRWQPLPLVGGKWKNKATWRRCVLSAVHFMLRLGMDPWPTFTSIAFKTIVAVCGDLHLVEYHKWVTARKRLEDTTLEDFLEFTGIDCEVGRESIEDRCHIVSHEDRRSAANQTRSAWDSTLNGFYGSCELKRLELVGCNSDGEFLAAATAVMDMSDDQFYAKISHLRGLTIANKQQEGFEALMKITDLDDLPEVCPPCEEDEDCRAFGRPGKGAAKDSSRRNADLANPGKGDRPDTKPVIFCNGAHSQCDHRLFVLFVAVHVVINGELPPLIDCRTCETRHHSLKMEIGGEMTAACPDAISKARMKSGKTAKMGSHKCALKGKPFSLAGLHKSFRTTIEQVNIAKADKQRPVSLEQIHKKIARCEEDLITQAGASKDVAKFQIGVVNPKATRIAPDNKGFLAMMRETGDGNRVIHVSGAERQFLLLLEKEKKAVDFGLCSTPLRPCQLQTIPFVSREEKQRLWMRGVLSEGPSLTTKVIHHKNPGILTSRLFQCGELGHETVHHLAYLVLLGVGIFAGIMEHEARCPCCGHSHPWWTFEAEGIVGVGSNNVQVICPDFIAALHRQSPYYKPDDGCHCEYPGRPYDLRDITVVMHKLESYFGTASGRHGPSIQQLYKELLRHQPFHTRDGEHLLSVLGIDEMLVFLNAELIATFEEIQAETEDVDIESNRDVKEIAEVLTKIEEGSHQTTDDWSDSESILSDWDELEDLTTLNDTIEAVPDGEALLYEAMFEGVHQMQPPLSSSSPDVDIDDSQPETEDMFSEVEIQRLIEDLHLHQLVYDFYELQERKDFRCKHLRDVNAGIAQMASVIARTTNRGHRLELPRAMVSVVRELLKLRFRHSSVAWKLWDSGFTDLSAAIEKLMVLWEEDEELREDLRRQDLELWEISENRLQHLFRTVFANPPLEDGQGQCRIRGRTALKASVEDYEEHMWENQPTNLLEKDILFTPWGPEHLTGEIYAAEPLRESSPEGKMQRNQLLDWCAHMHYCLRLPCGVGACKLCSHFLPLDWGEGTKKYSCMIPPDLMRQGSDKEIVEEIMQLARQRFGRVESFVSLTDLQRYLTRQQVIHADKDGNQDVLDAQEAYHEHNYAIVSLFHGGGEFEGVDQGASPDECQAWRQHAHEVLKIPCLRPDCLSDGCVLYGEHTLGGSPYVKRLLPTKCQDAANTAIWQQLAHRKFGIFCEAPGCHCMRYLDQRTILERNIELFCLPADEVEAPNALFAFVWDIPRAATELKLLLTATIADAVEKCLCRQRAKTKSVRSVGCNTDPPPLTTRTTGTSIDFDDLPCFGLLGQDHDIPRDPAAARLRRRSANFREATTNSFGLSDNDVAAVFEAVEIPPDLSLETLGMKKRCPRRQAPAEAYIPVEMDQTILQAGNRHRGKEYIAIYSLDPQYCKWVLNLSQWDLTHWPHQLGDFRSYLRKKAEQEWDATNRVLMLSTGPYPGVGLQDIALSHPEYLIWLIYGGRCGDAQKKLLDYLEVFEKCSSTGLSLQALQARRKLKLARKTFLPHFGLGLTMELCFLHGVWFFKKLMGALFHTRWEAATNLSQQDGWFQSATEWCKGVWLKAFRFWAGYDHLIKLVRAIGRCYRYRWLHGFLLLNEGCLNLVCNILWSLGEPYWYWLGILCGIMKGILAICGVNYAFHQLKYLCSAEWLVIPMQPANYRGSRCLRRKGTIRRMMRRLFRADWEIINIISGSLPILVNTFFSHAEATEECGSPVTDQEHRHCYSVREHQSDSVLGPGGSSLPMDVRGNLFEAEITDPTAPCGKPTVTLVLPDSGCSVANHLNGQNLVSLQLAEKQGWTIHEPPGKTESISVGNGGAKPLRRTVQHVCLDVKFKGEDLLPPKSGCFKPRVGEHVNECADGVHISGGPQTLCTEGGPKTVTVPRGIIALAVDWLHSTDSLVLGWVTLRREGFMAETTSPHHCGFWGTSKPVAVRNERRGIRNEPHFVVGSSDPVMELVGQGVNESELTEEEQFNAALNVENPKLVTFDELPDMNGTAGATSFNKQESTDRNTKVASFEELPEAYRKIEVEEHSQTVDDQAGLGNHLRVFEAHKNTAPTEEERHSGPFGNKDYDFHNDFGLHGSISDKTQGIGNEEFLSCFEFDSVEEKFAAFRKPNEAHEDELGKRLSESQKARMQEWCDSCETTSGLQQKCEGRNWVARGIGGVAMAVKLIEDISGGSFAAADVKLDTIGLDPSRPLSSQVSDLERDCNGFFAFDAAKGFLQFLLSPRLASICSWSCLNLTLRPLRLCLGLIWAPAFFSSFAAQIFGGLRDPMSGYDDDYDDVLVGELLTLAGESWNDLQNMAKDRGILGFEPFRRAKEAKTPEQLMSDHDLEQFMNANESGASTIQPNVDAGTRQPRPPDVQEPEPFRFERNFAEDGTGVLDEDEAGFVGGIPGVRFVLPHVDDLVTRHRRLLQAGVRLSQILIGCGSAGFCMSLKKFQIEDHLNVLGFFLNSRTDTRTVDPQKSSALQRMPEPRSAKELSKVSSLASCNREFIGDLREIVETLSPAVKSFKAWNDTLRAAFKTLTTALARGVELAEIDVDLANDCFKTGNMHGVPCVSIDASPSGVCVAIVQCNRLVHFSSKRFSGDVSRSTSSARIEALALLCFVRRILPTLGNVPLVICTDCATLCERELASPSMSLTQRNSLTTIACEIGDVLASRSTTWRCSIRGVANFLADIGTSKAAPSCLDTPSAFRRRIRNPLGLPHPEDESSSVDEDLHGDSKGCTTKHVSLQNEKITCTTPVQPFSRIVALRELDKYFSLSEQKPVVFEKGVAVELSVDLVSIQYSGTEPLSLVVCFGDGAEPVSVLTGNAQAVRVSDLRKGLRIVAGSVCSNRTLLPQFTLRTLRTNRKIDAELLFTVTGHGNLYASPDEEGKPDILCRDVIKTYHDSNYKFGAFNPEPSEKEPPIGRGDGGGFEDLDPTTEACGGLQPAPESDVKAEILQRRNALELKVSDEQHHQDVLKHVQKETSHLPFVCGLVIQKICVFYGFAWWQPGRAFPTVRTSMAYHPPKPNFEGAPAIPLRLQGILDTILRFHVFEHLREGICSSHDVGRFGLPSIQSASFLAVRKGSTLGRVVIHAIKSNLAFLPVNHSIGCCSFTWAALLGKEDSSIKVLPRLKTAWKTGSASFDSAVNRLLPISAFKLLAGISHEDLINRGGRQRDPFGSLRYLSIQEVRGEMTGSFTGAGPFRTVCSSVKRITDERGDNFRWFLSVEGRNVFTSSGTRWFRILKKGCDQKEAYMKMCLVAAEFLKMPVTQHPTTQLFRAAELIPPFEDIAAGHPRFRRIRQLELYDHLSVAHGCPRSALLYCSGGVQIRRCLCDIEWPQEKNEDQTLNTLSTKEEDSFVKELRGYDRTKNHAKFWTTSEETKGNFGKATSMFAQEFPGCEGFSIASVRVLGRPSVSGSEGDRLALGMTFRVLQVDFKKLVTKEGGEDPHCTTWGGLGEFAVGHEVSFWESICGPEGHSFLLLFERMEAVERCLEPALIDAIRETQALEHSEPSGIIADKENGKIPKDVQKELKKRLKKHHPESDAADMRLMWRDQGLCRVGVAGLLEHRIHGKWLILLTKTTTPLLKTRDLEVDSPLSHILRLCHLGEGDVEHLRGSSLFYAVINRGFYFPTLYDRCLQWTRGCLSCTVTSPDLPRVGPGISRIEACSCAGAVLFADFVGPLPITPEGHTHLLTFDDACSLFPHLFPCVPSVEVVLASLKTVLAEESCQVMRCDNGSEFLGSFQTGLRALSEEFGYDIWAQHAPGYLPSGQFPVEAPHQIINRQLRIRLGLRAETLPVRRLESITYDGKAMTITTQDSGWVLGNSVSQPLLNDDYDPISQDRINQGGFKEFGNSGGPGKGKAGTKGKPVTKAKAKGKAKSKSKAKQDGDGKPKEKTSNKKDTPSAADKEASKSHPILSAWSECLVNIERHLVRLPISAWEGRCSKELHHGRMLDSRSGPRVIQDPTGSPCDVSDKLQNTSEAAGSARLLSRVRASRLSNRKAGRMGGYVSPVEGLLVLRLREQRRKLETSLVGIVCVVTLVLSNFVEIVRADGLAYRGQNPISFGELRACCLQVEVLKEYLLSEGLSVQDMERRMVELQELGVEFSGTKFSEAEEELGIEGERLDNSNFGACTSLLPQAPRVGRYAVLRGTNQLWKVNSVLKEGRLLAARVSGPGTSDEFFPHQLQEAMLCANSASCYRAASGNFDVPKGHEEEPLDLPTTEVVYWNCDGVIATLRKPLRLRAFSGTLARRPRVIFLTESELSDKTTSEAHKLLSIITPTHEWHYGCGSERLGYAGIAIGIHKSAAGSVSVSFPRIGPCSEFSENRVGDPRDEGRLARAEDNEFGSVKPVLHDVNAGHLLHRPPVRVEWERLLVEWVLNDVQRSECRNYSIYSDWNAAYSFEESEIHGNELRMGALSRPSTTEAEQKLFRESLTSLGGIRHIPTKEVSLAPGVRARRNAIYTMYGSISEYFRGRGFSLDHYITIKGSAPYQYLLGGTGRHDHQVLMVTQESPPVEV